MGNLEQAIQEREKLINELVELQKEKIEDLTNEELKEVIKNFTNSMGYCECGNNFKNELDEELGFCGDCR